MTAHSNRHLQTDYNPELRKACQTETRIAHKVCSIVRAPSKDDIVQGCQTGNRIVPFKMMFVALRTKQRGQHYLAKKGDCCHCDGGETKSTPSLLAFGLGWSLTKIYFGKRLCIFI